MTQTKPPSGRHRAPTRAAAYAALLAAMVGSIRTAPDEQPERTAGDAGAAVER